MSEGRGAKGRGCRDGGGCFSLLYITIPATPAIPAPLLTNEAKMTPTCTLINARVFTGTDILPNASVRVAGGYIQEVSTGPLPGSHRIDLRGQWVVPGFVDLQLYGGSEAYLNEHPTVETVEHIYQTHLKNGTTSIVPTLYSTSQAVILKSVEAVRQGMLVHPNGVLGLHVEGPYLNPEKRGAHSLTYVRPPDERELNELFDRGRDVLRILTIAPEQFSTQQLRALIEQAGSQTQLSVGHSHATYAQAMAAFDAGVPLATHLYNAMRSFESREPGVVGAIFDHPNVRASIIADGHHCDFAAVRIAHRLLGDRLFFISDATFANPPRPAYAHEDFIIRYENQRYVNHEGKLAGSAITLLDAVRNGVHKVGLSPEQAFRMASTIPAEILGLGNRLGKVQVGYVANLVVLNERLELTSVLTDGSVTAPLSWQ